MANDDDKPIPNLDAPSAMESLLKRIAEGVERLERKQPPSVPPSMTGDQPSAMPPQALRQSPSDQPSPMQVPHQSSVDQPLMQPPVVPPSMSDPSSMPPQQFANAGNINIEGKGKESPSIFGRAAISLQSATNMMADYGLRTPPAMHAMASYAKVASLMSGDVHTRGEQLAGKGLRPNTGGDQDQMMRSLELGGRSRNRGGESSSDASPQIARNDLKDSLDSLKDSIDQLRDAVKEMAPAKSGSQQSAWQGGSRQSYPFAQPPQPSGTRSRPQAIGVGRPANIAANTL